MKRLIPLALALALMGCATNTQPTSQISTVLTQLANTATADISTQINVANAATPPDADGAACGAAALQVAAAIQKVVLVTAPPAAGAFTVAEIASLYQPGSAQFQWAEKILVSGCAAKVIDVQQAANTNLSIAGIIGSIPTVLPLAAAAL